MLRIIDCMPDILCNGLGYVPQNYSFLWGIQAPTEDMVPLAHLSPHLNDTFISPIVVVGLTVGKTDT